MTRVLLPSLLVAVALLGCGERPVPAPIADDVAPRYAELICATQRDCGCALFESDAACEDYVVALFDDMKSHMRAFDEDCFEELLASEAIQSCLPTDAYITAYHQRCDAASGDLEAGEPCGQDTILNWMAPALPCKAGTTCSLRSGLCEVDPSYWIVDKPAGTPCSDQLDLDCGIQTYCNGESCEARVADGEPCANHDACLVGSFCQGYYEQGTGTCTPMLSEGEPCNPKDYKSCAPVAEGYLWCNPETLTCDGLYPYMCAVMTGSLLGVW